MRSGSHLWEVWIGHHWLNNNNNKTQPVFFTHLTTEQLCVLHSTKHHFLYMHSSFTDGELKSYKTLTWGDKSERRKIKYFDATNGPVPWDPTKYDRWHWLVLKGTLWSVAQPSSNAPASRDYPEKIQSPQPTCTWTSQVKLETNLVQP